ncbi:Hypothetical protein GSB_155282, partial [Giardia duodenalis]
VPLGDQHYPVPELPVNPDHYQKQQVGDSLHGVPGVDEDDAGQCRWKNYDPRSLCIAIKQLSQSLLTGTVGDKAGLVNR